MLTWSAKSVWPKDSPNYTGDVPTLEDIAVGLGRQSRFAGHTREFYTVLNHVLVCGKLADELSDDPELRRYVLLHDSSETVLGDVVTTWKPAQFSALEEELFELIYLEHGLQYPWPADMNRDIKAIDYAALVGEAHALGHAAAEQYWPRAEMSLLAKRAESLTLRQVEQGRPFEYLEPEAAIEAFRLAWR